jgi:hypothetical protein
MDFIRLAALSLPSVLSSATGEKYHRKCGARSSIIVFIQNISVRQCLLMLQFGI